MRWAVLCVMVWVAGCASDKLALAPPAGVDFTGRWRLNAADSDDPQRVLLTQSEQAAEAARSRPQGAPGAMPPLGLGAAPVPSVSALSEGVAWPGRDLEVHQREGVIIFRSGGVDRTYVPSSADAHTVRRGDDSRRRDEPRGRSDAPPVCGWDERTLVVLNENGDDPPPPFQRRYDLSPDGARLIETVRYQGSFGESFALTRVWDRVTP